MLKSVGGYNQVIYSDTAPSSSRLGQLWMDTASAPGILMELVALSPPTWESVTSTGSSGVTSFNTRTGAVTLTSGDVTGALGYTPGTGNGTIVGPLSQDVTTPSASSGVATVKSVAGGFAFNGQLDDTSTFASTTMVANYAPTGGANAVVWNVLPQTAPCSISSIAVPPTNSSVICIRNSSTTLPLYVSGLNGARNNVALYPGEAALFIYDIDAAGWDCVTGPHGTSSTFIITTPGTYSSPPPFPAGAFGAFAVLVGAGGGGGGGACDVAGNVVSGGNGGNSGCVTWFDLSGVIPTSYIVGAGGTGGAGGTQGNAGSTGSNGGNSSMTCGSAVIYASGGIGGNGGALGAAPAAQIAPTNGGNLTLGFVGGTGGVGGGTATAGADIANVPQTLYVATGGGGGGGVTAAGGGENAGRGGNSPWGTTGAPGGRSSSSVTSHNGNNGSYWTSGGNAWGGGGGGGGGPNTNIGGAAVTAGAGGIGFQGAGGGGGGAQRGANAASQGGTGGTGGQGYILFVSY